MATGDIGDIMYQLFVLAVQLAGPVLVISMLVGILIAILQAATQIHEQTLTFVPKILAVFAVMLLVGAWMLNNMSDFMVQLWSDFSLYV